MLCKWVGMIRFEPRDILYPKQTCYQAVLHYIPFQNCCTVVIAQNPCFVFQIVILSCWTQGNYSLKWISYSDLTSHNYGRLEPLNLYREFSLQRPPATFKAHKPLKEHYQQISSLQENLKHYIPQLNCYNIRGWRHQVLIDFTIKIISPWDLDGNLDSTNVGFTCLT